VCAREIGDDGTGVIELAPETAREVHDALELSQQEQVRS
jgi:hypothetical protein